MFSDNLIRNILKKAGALRIDKNAIKRFKIVLDSYAYEIARKSVKNAQYLGRKVVRASDIEEVIKTR